MNSYRHAQSCARKWGGTPEDYLPIHEFIDSSKQAIGDYRHRSLYHHTLGVFLCQKIFGATITITKGDRKMQVPVREIAERHIIEDLGWLPSPANYAKHMNRDDKWMSGMRARTQPLSDLGLTVNKEEHTTSE